MTKEEKSSSGSVFSSMLTVAFITLKLCNVIAWPWWQVLLPLYAPIALVFIFSICYVVVSRIKNENKR